MKNPRQPVTTISWPVGAQLYYLLLSHELSLANHGGQVSTAIRPSSRTKHAAARKLLSSFAEEEDRSRRRQDIINNKLYEIAMKVLFASKTTSDVDGLEEVLSKMFGKPVPPKEEILRHKWLGSEKAGHDVGVLAAAHDWRVKYYTHWKEIHASSTGMVAPRAGSVSRRRLKILAG